MGRIIEFFAEETADGWYACFHDPNDVTVPVEKRGPFQSRQLAENIWLDLLDRVQDAGG